MQKLEKNYAFILGSNPALSTWEILSILREKYQKNSLKISKEVLFVIGEEIDSKTIDSLGGTIKIVEILKTFEKKHYDPNEIVDSITEYIEERAADKTKKFHLGISVYDLNGSKNMLFRLSRSLRFFYINIKKKSQKLGQKVAFLNTKDRVIASASIINNDLMTENGAEFSLISTPGSVLVGKTVAVQDIFKYTQMDVGRPERDLVSGTTPPKLAKIMVNLAGKDKNSVMLDPFCGSGTFLQEMYLLGFRKIFGSDISKDAIEISKKNIEWLLEKNKENQDLIKLTEIDALKLKDSYNSNFFDAVISEVYLGPPLRSFLGEKELKKLVFDLSELYQKVFVELSTVLKNDGVAVLALPIFRTKNGIVLLDINEGLKKSRLKIDTHSEFKNEEFRKFITERNTVIYSRPDQLVYREIIVLKKSL